MQTLVPNTLPLDCHALIEASAGTGKTYTITTLYLRAVLGLISERSNQSLSVDEILVVTFTEAATDELKSRIRSRLKEAQSAILKLLTVSTTDKVKDVDPTVLAIIELAYEKQVKQASGDTAVVDDTVKDRDVALSIYNKIQQNITLIDEASIFTIHGFCQRVLNQFAFETQMSFEQSFDLDNTPYLNHALEDFWRSRMSGLTGFEYHIVKSMWKHPEQLKKELQQLIDKPIHIAPALTQEAYQNVKQMHQEALFKLWNTLQGSDLTEVVNGAALKKNSPQNKHLTGLQTFINTPFGEVLPDAAVIEAYTTESFADQSNYLAKKPAVSHPLSSNFDACVDYCKKFESSDVKGYWLELAKEAIEQGAQAIKSEQQTLTPDDLLLRLQVAVKSPDNQALIAAVQQKYPLAFIDEFQDTDPIQYAIFKSVYQCDLVRDATDESDERERPKPTMIMIGDPKQAIYKFRGADINTYITAKTDLAESQHFTLDKNWRSHPKLINAINAMYNNSEYQFGHDAIPFVDVGAGQSESKRLISFEPNNQMGSDLPVLNLMHLTSCDLDENKSVVNDNKGMSFSDAKLSLAKLCATKIKAQLQQSQQGLLALADGNKDAGRKVEGKDIAVLVRSRYQAKLIKQALRDLGVDSVYLSRDSVFDSALARDTLRLLEAINSPTNEKRVRAAASTVFFSYLPEYQLALQSDERQWHRLLAAFYKSNELWQQGKVTNAIQTIMIWADTLTLWQRSGLGFERLITDMRHLEQLIQEQAAKLPGHEKLLVWYRQSVTEIESNEALSLRLESDRNLVQIVTMHGSKGLEYPIVYLPFVTEFSKEKVPLYFDQPTGQLVYRTDKRQIDMQKAEKERLDEDIRLLYVAMTRAKFQLNLSTFTTLERVNSKGSSIGQSAFGRMVLGDDSSSPSDSQWQEALVQYIEKLSVGSSTTQVSYELLDKTDVATLHQSAARSPYTVSEADVSLSVAEFNGRIDKRWSVLSFSAIAHNNEQDTESKMSQAKNPEKRHDGVIPPVNNVWLPGVSDEVNDTLLQEIQVEQADDLIPYRFRFPKGANAGSCLHYIYEFLDFTAPVRQQTEVIDKALTKYGLTDINVEALVDWLQSTLHTPIFMDKSVSHKPHWTLSDLTSTERLDEMEFYFSFEQLNSEVVGNALRLAGFDNINYNNALLSGDGLKGRLKGFIDLTCRIGEQYFVMDYKSNYLGDDFVDYGKEQLCVSMSDHNYYLQLLIYTYALHRFLKVRISNYDYERHVGGGVYLFLRGMSDASPAAQTDQSNISGVFHHRVDEAAIRYLDKAMLGNALPISGEQVNKMDMERTNG